MKKTAKRLTAVLLSLVILTGISGAAFADAEHDDCECCHSETHEAEATRAIMCDGCGRNGMVRRLFGIIDWAYVGGVDGRRCLHGYGTYEYYSVKTYQYYYICTYCEHTEPVFNEYEYAWYCGVNDVYYYV